MDRRERWAEPVEALRAALDGRQAEMWTALPGIVQSFDPAAMTVSVQPAVAGRISDEAGKAASVDLPILPDVPVVFPGGGGFALTFPVAAGTSACGVRLPLHRRVVAVRRRRRPMEPRMHDLSDGSPLSACAASRTGCPRRAHGEHAAPRRRRERLRRDHARRGGYGGGALVRHRQKRRLHHAGRPRIVIKGCSPCSRRAAARPRPRSPDRSTPRAT
ncbi:MAG: Gp138 family membrane-puncturing spike protein [Bilophila wadsworthia]